MHPYGVQMLGHFIIKAIMQQLIEDYKINTKGTSVSTCNYILHIILFSAVVYIYIYTCNAMG